SPIIATILLIGVAVMAVGGIYTFTQGRLGSLKGGGAPQANIVLSQARFMEQNPPGPEVSPACSSGYFSNENYVTQLKIDHKGGDAIPWTQLKITVTDTEMKRSFTVSYGGRSGTWESGETVYIVEDDSSSTTEVGSDLAGEHCVGGADSGNYQRGYNNHPIEVVLKHKKTGKTIATLNARLK
ncbi:MAG: type IV pilin N-terminal domain-containing protein, partial [Candidatus Nanosalina sp.]